MTVTLTTDGAGNDIAEMATLSAEEAEALAGLR